MNDLIDLKQIELHFEKANMAAAQVERHATLTVSIAITSGESLVAAKALIPRGEWSEWVGKHWNHSHRLANNYMEIANSQRAANLKDATSIREALRIIYQESGGEPELTPRSARQSDRVTVVEPGQQPVQADDDPAPDLPTTRTTAAGSRKKSEATKPRTQPITPELLPDEPEPDPVDVWIESHSLKDVIDRMCSRLEDDKARKVAAKQLRKLADKLDPPTKFVPPELEEVTAYFSEIGCDLSAQYFIDFYAKGGWMISKGKPMKEWHSAARNANDRWDRSNGNTGKKSGTARVPAPPRKPIVYHE